MTRKERASTYATKKRIANNLKKLMNESDGEKVTVTQIVEMSGINRKTFYYHFKDMHDLMVWLFQDENLRIIKEMADIDGYEEAIRFALNYATENEKMLKYTSGSMAAEAVGRLFLDETIEIVTRALKECQTELRFTYDPEYERTIAHFYSFAIIGMLTEWIYKEDKSDPEREVKYICTIIKASLDIVATRAKNGTIGELV